MKWDHSFRSSRRRYLTWSVIARRTEVFAWLHADWFVCNGSWVRWLAARFRKVYRRRCCRRLMVTVRLLCCMECWALCSLCSSCGFRGTLKSVRQSQGQQEGLDDYLGFTIAPGGGKTFRTVRRGCLRRRICVQSFAAYWFYLRFGVRPAALGAIFFGQIFSRVFRRC